jgi:CRP-like cAMP-binding protein
MSLSEENSLAASCEFTENLNLLRQIPFFSGMPLESLKVFAYLCTREKFRPGDHLVRQAEDDGLAFYIISGRVAVERREGEQTIVLRTLEPGAFLGGLSLLAESPRLFSLRAETEVLTLVLGREKFTKAIRQYPDQVQRILNAVVEAIGAWETAFLANRAEACAACLPNLGVSLL